LIVAWTLSPPFPPVSDIQIRRDKGVRAIQIRSCECGMKCPIYQLFQI
jgi:hypothetical protein